MRVTVAIGTDASKYDDTNFVGREQELAVLKTYLECALNNKGSTVFIAGEAGIGKTRLVEKFISYADAKKFKLLRSCCQKDVLTPYIAFRTALKSAGLEYLIQDKPPPKLECVYLVNKAGLLLAECVRREAQLDSMIFTAMLTAVGEFVRDSMQKFDSTERGGGLNLLGYQDRSILINQGVNADLVAIMTGEPNEFLKDDMDEVQQAVDKNYGSILQSWDGDMAKVSGTAALIEPLITSGKYDGIDYARELDSPKLKMNTLYDNVLSGLIRESKKQPILIFIDDLQWADTSTLGLLHYIARNTRAAPILIIGAYRAEDIAVPEDGKTHPLAEQIQLMRREELLKEIGLSRFEGEEIKAILNAHFGSVNLPDELFNRLYKESEGNPLFALEVFKMLIDEKIVEYDAVSGAYQLRAEVECDRINIPQKIYDVVTRRLNRLEREYREILEPAAVEGEYFSSQIIEKVLGLNRLKLLRALNTIERVHKLIHSLKEKYKFDHVKIREIIYNGLNAELRKEYHKLIGNCIEEQNKDALSTVVGELATHYYFAEEINKAIPYLIQSAEKAKNEFAVKEAVQFYQRAIEFLDRKKTFSSQKIEVLQNLGDIYGVVGNYDASIECFHKALTDARACKNDEVLPELNRKIGDAYEKKGLYEKALQYYDNALAIARSSSIEEARIYSAISWTYLRQGAYDKASRHAEICLQIAKNQKNDREVAHAFHILGSIYWNKGDYELALKFLSEALTIRKGINDIRGLSASYNNIGVVYRNKGELDKALKYYEKSLQLYEKTSDTYGLAAAYNNIGLIHYERGEFEQALSYYTKSLTKREKIGDSYGLATSYNNIGLVYQEKGVFAVAEDYYMRSLGLRIQIGDTRGIAMSYNAMGLLYAEKEDWTKATDYYVKSLSLSEKIGEKWLSIYSYTGLCICYAHTGKIEAALEYGRKALSLSTEINARDAIAESNKALAIAYTAKQEWLLAGKHFKDCIEYFGQIGRESGVAKCRYEYSLMLKAKGDFETANKQLQTALKIFERKQMQKWIEKVKNSC